MSSSSKTFALVGALTWLPLAVRAEPYTPTNGQQVLERLRAPAWNSAERELRQWRARLAVDPGNLPLAAQYARRCLERSRADADPRYLGRAEAALAPWWNEARPPLDVLVLRATLKQSQHDFSGALADLDAGLETSPTDPRLWLTRATVLTVLGRYDEARQACRAMAGRAPELVTLGTAANLAALSGAAERSGDLLRGALERDSAATVAERLWAETVLAEIEARRGPASAAERCFQRALALGQRDAYLLGAYADFLLDQGRAGEVAALLKEETRADGLLLRLALAESQLNPTPAGLEAHIAALRARFEASHLRGETLHQREEARFALRLLRQPQQALRLAQANWQVQHEPADVRILLEAALAARDPAAAQPALEFLARTRLEDARLRHLANDLAHLKPSL